MHIISLLMSIQNNMEQLTVKTEKKNKFFITALIISAAAHIVLFCINLYCGNIHVDEAMTIINARSLADNATDIMGERLPVYFDTWLYGGQSPFATYLLAVFFKIFGYSLFISRLPMLIFCMVGLVFFYYFLKELFPENEKFVNIVFLFAAFSPWQLQSSMFTLDCNFMPHILIIGLYFLAKAVNTKKTKFYIASMIFFGLGFYCYILSAIIIPLFLAPLYAMLILKRKTDIKNTLISIVTIFIVGLPFILFGLVQLKVIDEFTLFGFNYSYMPYYARTSSINTDDAFLNLLTGVALLIFPDFYVFGTKYANRITYTNAFGGVFTLFGIISLFKTIASKKQKKNSFSLMIIISSFVPSIAICILCFNPGGLYRFFSYNYIYYIIMGFGAIYLLKYLKRIKLKVLICTFMCCSFVVLCASLNSVYSYNSINNSNIYIDSLVECLDEAEAADYNNIGISFLDYGNQEENNFKAVFYNERTIITLIFDNYENLEDFNSLDKALISCGPLSLGDISNDFNLSKSNNFYPKDIFNDPNVNDDCLICYSEFIDDLKYDKSNYKISNHGVFTVMYKN